MKRFLLTFVFICAITHNSFAQDLIVTQDGNILKAYKLDIGTKSVYFSVEDKEGADIKSILKDDILIIKFRDGGTQTFEVQQTSSQVNADGAKEEDIEPKTFISYGFSEDKPDQVLLKAEFYLKYIWGLHHGEKLDQFKDAIVIWGNW